MPNSTSCWRRRSSSASSSTISCCAWPVNIARNAEPIVKPHGLRIGFALLVLVSGFACQREQDRTCVELGRQYVEKPGRDLSNVATESFFSPAFDACIHSEVAKVGVQFDIVDLSQSIIRTGNRLL